MSVEDGQIYLVAPDPSTHRSLSTSAIVTAKERVRRQMAARVAEQIQRPQTQQFILRLERARFTPSGAQSILSLIADGPALARSLQTSGAEAVRPYIQSALADDGRDPTTGLALWEIFRYFRYFWSFPVNSAPGRTVPFLIRDAGQPGHPVCGLLAIASPVPKLAVRDAALGWTAAWLEAVVAGLWLDPDDPGPRLRQIERDARRLQDALDSASVFSALSSLLGLQPARDVEAVIAGLRRLDQRERRRRAADAHRRLLADLRAEIRSGLGDICFDGFGCTCEEALDAPAKAIRRVERLGAAALERWRTSRAISVDGPLVAGRVHEEDAPRRAAREPLFRKKRAHQAARLLRGWQDIAPEPNEHPEERLRALVFGAGSSEPPASLTGGSRVAGAVRKALLQRQTRFVASQIAEVAVCGALPPYGPLLGGKLAALLSFSREVATTYHARYSRQASVITSQMAGRPVIRPADLLALTTTSFYAVGSAQYERVKLPAALGGISWRYVGLSRGHGSLHFSRETTDSLQALLELETGKRLISGQFGEGPSERMRKLRDGLKHVGLNADELVTHGMGRRVYVAELRPGAALGARSGGAAWRRCAPEAEQIAAFWRARWLEPRLARSPDLLADVATFNREAALLSVRQASAR
ncbi:Druantia anti-phage system protein DruA [Sorangium sp. So ce367]|uniref:Druantia anti-phage system protein DruA n=1 Tax=Sorangium sp. So ce367 TaxID=3133305 RepID=UPI003F625F87